MDKELLKSTAQKIVAPGKGVLALDKSLPSANKTLEELGIEATEENRRRYRELFIGTKGIGKYLNGIILFDESFRQKDTVGTPFVEIIKDEGILVGIKVDKGTVPIPETEGEKFAMGLDNLDARLKEYFDGGANFAKWRSVFPIGKDIPSRVAIEINADSLALYASLCQQTNIVPVVEPEVLYDGDHTIEESFEATLHVLKGVFNKLSAYKVDLDCLVLKTSMVLPGKLSNQKVSDKAIAQATIECLKEVVPPEVAGVLFLSGGQMPSDATKHLNEIAKLEPLPWEVAFSFERAIEDPALQIWRGKDENVKKARVVFEETLKNNVAADAGEYKN